MATIYDTINTLEDVGFIAGTKYKFEFFLYDDNGGVLDASAATMVWRLAVYGQPESTVLEKSGTYIASNEMDVILDSTDTEDLSGNYMQQSTIIDGAGNEFVPGQGRVVIAPKLANI